MNKNFKNLVSKIRADKYIGTGSCSPVDECLTDDELIELLEENNIKPNQTRKAFVFLYHHHNSVCDYLGFSHSIFISDEIIKKAGK